MAERRRVVILPGAVLPGNLAFIPLLDALGGRADAAVKELEVYATDEPPVGYGLDDEVDGILRVADERGFERFHLVGYSAGGACSLAFAARHPERLASLALLEPAWAGNDRLPSEERLWAQLRGLSLLPPEERMARFQRLQVTPAVELPPAPAGAPPPWMAKRPAGIQALLDAFDAYDLDVARLRAFTRPVYFAVGGRSHPDYFALEAERLWAIFPDFTLETFPERHHFDPPHRAEPDRLAASLEALWERADR